MSGASVIRPCKCLMARALDKAKLLIADTREESIMINQQPTDRTQGDLSQGTSDSRNSAESQKKTSKIQPKGGKARGTGTEAGESRGDDRAGREARPGTDPKNPGDFGHH
jgi:hypothetical protein